MSWAAIVSWITSNFGAIAADVGGLIALIEDLFKVIHPVAVAQPAAVMAVKSAVEAGIALNDPHKVRQAIEAGILALKK